MIPPLWQKVKKAKKPLDESERGDWKSWLKAQHSENEDHGISPIISWQIDEETMADFIFGGSKITADGDCSHEITPWEESYDLHRQHIKKQRQYFAD